VFLCLCGALLEEIMGIICIDVFRSNEVGWRKSEANRTVDDEKR
jgi:hypothetical protein